jgi:hypothetical protein
VYPTQHERHSRESGNPVCFTNSPSVQPLFVKHLQKNGIPDLRLADARLVEDDDKVEKGILDTEIPIASLPLRPTKAGFRL